MRSTLRAIWLLVPDPFSKVDVERKITAFDFRDVRSGHRGLLNAGDEQRSEQRRIVFAEPAFGQVHNQDQRSRHAPP